MPEARRYPVPAVELRRELIVVNSRFIATLAPVFSVEQAKSLVARIRTEFPGASHHVPAYLIGHGDSLVAHCSDAGEPSGTAGRPALAVLQGSGLGDAAVVVTRYFGGTKLGTGGLVRAYGDAVRAVVEVVPRAIRVITHTVMIEFPYRYVDRMRLLVAAQRGENLGEDFAVQVTLSARFAVEDLAPFQKALSDLTHGAIQAVIVDTGEILMPLPPEAQSL